MLAHGAGSNSQAPLLVALADAFAEAGWLVLRCDLPYRQSKRFGPPPPGAAKSDREGLKNAVAELRKLAPGKVYLGGHSYGGRQASMLLAEEPVADALLLLSYPLHPPKQPEKLRTAHFPTLRTPALFVQGTRDPFGSAEELRPFLKLIAAPTMLIEIDGAGHDLGFGKSGRGSALGLPAQVVATFQQFIRANI